ncbi:MAG: hypothetical protein WCC37_25955 [Candidatus Sulfotelmatobacter sp.]
MARYDFGLSDEEFEELTPVEFKGLGTRRVIAIKYQRFAGAQSAAATYNVNRGEESPIITAMDFVRDDEKQAEMERKRNMRRVLNQLGMTRGDRKKLLMLRAKMIADLKARGNRDAEEMCNEVWPSLKPTDKDTE